MYRDWDTRNNQIKDCAFTNNAYGIAFGAGLVSLDLTANSGKQTGPLKNTIMHCEFLNINKHAVWAKYGTKNYLSNNNYETYYR